MHNRGSYAVCEMCYDSKDNDGAARAKNQTHYEVAYVRLKEKYEQTSKVFYAIYDANNEKKEDTFIPDGILSCAAGHI